MVRLGFFLQTWLQAKSRNSLWLDPSYLFILKRRKIHLDTATSWIKACLASECFIHYSMKYWAWEWFQEALNDSNWSYLPFQQASQVLFDFRHHPPQLGIDRLCLCCPDWHRLLDFLKRWGHLKSSGDGEAILRSGPKLRMCGKPTFYLRSHQKYEEILYWTHIRYILFRIITQIVTTTIKIKMSPLRRIATYAPNNLKWNYNFCNSFMKKCSFLKSFRMTRYGSLPYSYTRSLLKVQSNPIEC